MLPRSSVSGVVPAENLAAVSPHDAVADAQAQSGAFSGLLGCEEGIENALGLGDTGSVVDERHFDESCVRRVRMRILP